MVLLVAQAVAVECQILLHQLVALAQQIKDSLAEVMAMAGAVVAVAQVQQGQQVSVLSEGQVAMVLPQ